MPPHPANYDKFPTVPVPAAHTRECWIGWKEIAQGLRTSVEPHSVLVVDCYPGVHVDDVRDALAAALQPTLVLDTREAFKPAEAIDDLVAPDLRGNDPIFGHLTRLRLDDFLDPHRVAKLRAAISLARGLAIVVGPGAALVCPEFSTLVYADMPRWEGQLRQRRNEVPNLGVANHSLPGPLKYKRAFFVDWRAADREKRRTMARWDFLLDTTHRTTPKLITGAAHLAALDAAVRQPFRVVPFFDPGPWGGQWMKEVCDLDRNARNFAWCFDCVPEENSLLLAFARAQVEIPAINLVFREPERLLGEAVHARFGAEFPIRFDFLDTMGGGNLSLQVHPSAEQAREEFGLPYTQDESYYILDAKPGARVYLGRASCAERAEMFAALAAAQHSGQFDVEKYAASFQARPHDHFLIPAGTLHCSGAGSMVLEISATPYIFTFKLWDWGRVGLDGKPRPINLERGQRAIHWERDADYAQRHLVNRVTPVASGVGWREERTGLHPTEFIETRRHWFSGPVAHDTSGGVNVLNLVQGEAALVESPTEAFSPFVVHYAETFIVPAAVGCYTIRPYGRVLGAECATLKAFVRA
jgi:mannose-6-phosphate isomerase class I